MRSPALTAPHGQPTVVRLETRPGPATSCLVIAKLVVFIGYGFFLAEAINSGEAGDIGPAVGQTNADAPAPRTLRVAGAQLPVRNDVQKNLEAINRAIEFAAREKADVLLTPEGSLSGYGSVAEFVGRSG